MPAIPISLICLEKRLLISGVDPVQSRFPRLPESLENPLDLG